MTRIANDSLLSGSFPSVCKHAVAKLLLRKPALDHSDLKNYRPVSNLSFLSKVIEKIVLRQLFDYLDSNDLLCPSQSAYRPCHSPEKALLKIANDVLGALDDDHVAVLILLDPSSAFDAIGHYILLHRLRSLYGISGSVLLWFESYLTGRTQTAIVNDKSSRRVFFGVREGSVLGPILFIVYSTPLSSLGETHSVSNQSFADDTQVLHSCPPTKLLSTVLTMQTCISDVKTWMTQNKLKLNDDKTEVLLIKSNRPTFPNAQPTSLCIGSADIPFMT